MHRFTPFIGFNEQINVGKWYIIFEDEGIELIFPNRDKMREFYDLITEVMQYESRSGKKR